MAAAIAITIEDAKGLKSVTHHYIPTTFSVSQAIEAAQTLVGLIDNITAGRVVGVGVCYDVSLPGGIKLIADALSDVEEGARFGWRTVNNFLSSIRLPTFLETLFASGTKQVSLEDLDVDAYVDAVLTGIVVTGGTVTFTDFRNEDLVSVASAREQFRKDRG